MAAGGEKFAQARGSFRHGIGRGDAGDIKAGAAAVSEEGGLYLGGRARAARRIANGRVPAGTVQKSRSA
jgi:hypothetical protein